MRETSLEAYRESQSTALYHRDAIRACLLKRKQGTTAQISKWTGLDYHAVARRMSELVKQEMVLGNETIICPIKERKCTLWVLNVEL